MEVHWTLLSGGLASGSGPGLGVHLILLEGMYCFTETPHQFMCLPVIPKRVWEIETRRNLNFSIMPQFLSAIMPC